jgi:hypothetical protein
MTISFHREEKSTKKKIYVAELPPSPSNSSALILPVPTLSMYRESLVQGEPGTGRGAVRLGLGVLQLSRGTR